MQRRNFLKLGALGATSLTAKQLSSVEQGIFDEKMDLCANKFGAFYVKTIGGRVVDTQPFEGDAAPTVLNNALSDHIQNETRVKYPYIRKSFLADPNNPKPELRGREEFVRVSWDTAIQLSAKILKENHDKYGSEAIYGQVYQWGSLGKVGHGQRTAKRMLNVLGGYVNELGGYSYGAAQTILPHVTGSIDPTHNPTKWEAILKEAKTIVFWGTNPVVSNKIAIGVPMHNSYHYYAKMKELQKKKELKIYSVDVYNNETSQYLDADFIGVVPCSDTAMMLGMCHYLYESGKFDKAFIDRYTVGFDKFLPYLLGKTDGVVKNLAWATKICGVSEAKLKELTDTLAKDNAVIVTGYAIQRQHHGEMAYWALITLSAMLGHIGKIGGGFVMNDQMHKNADETYIAPKLKAFSPQVSDKFIAPNGVLSKPQGYEMPNSRLIDALLEPGKELARNGKIYKLPHIRVIFNANGSTFTRHQDTNRAVAALKKVSAIITTEPFWTSNAKFSDIVLPVALECERTDIEFANSSGEYLFAIKPLVTPIGESKSDFEIARLLCKEWGREEAFSESKTELEWVKEIYADAANKARGLGVQMPSFDEFWERGYVKFDKVDESKRYFTNYADFRADPSKNPLKTPSGKLEIYSETIASFGYDDCPPHATWMPPFEWLGDKNKKYPIAVSGAHSKFRLHSQLNNSVLRNYNEIREREPVLISPKTAAERGIKTGDVVRVYNDRGEILCGALVSEMALDDVIIISEGAWYDPIKFGEKSLCKHGNINVLTKDIGSSKLSQSNTAHTSLVQVEKFKGKLEPISAFDRPVTIENL
ncbi:molybdopterin-dependent oxidoreductase [Campylobacter sp. faydin G-105]|uniref:molybdopterin-dependent oxidoreductase n=1 Tax=Campylobacter anatolicus TaxID=2829105 RepID=UPI001B9A6DA8|nr:molybdopterin-dependent oxidoreductase [Campylobacter anatolicus]MBR8462394.1 molybdopterin-dependent oxidoreductase [Campylobacter anatolicus]